MTAKCQSFLIASRATKANILIAWIFFSVAWAIGLVSNWTPALCIKNGQKCFKLLQIVMITWTKPLDIYLCACFCLDGFWPPAVVYFRRRRGRPQQRRVPVAGSTEAPSWSPPWAWGCPPSAWTDSQAQCDARNERPYGGPEHYYYF